VSGITVEVATNEESKVRVMCGNGVESGREVGKKLGR
jgi:hypothetical protein